MDGIGISEDVVAAVIMYIVVIVRWPLYTYL